MLAHRYRNQKKRMAAYCRRKYGVLLELTPEQRAEIDAEVEAHADAILQVAAYHRKDYDLTMVYVSATKTATIQPWLFQPFARPAGDSSRALSSTPLASSTAEPTTSSRASTRNRRPDKSTVPDPSIPSSTKRAYSAPAGFFSLLPPEVLVMIIHQIDVQSVFRLSHASNGMRYLLSRIGELPTLSQHAAAAIGALIRTKMAPHVPILALYDALCTKTCSGKDCRRFAGYCFMPSMSRRCFLCTTRGGSAYFTAADLAAANLNPTEWPFVHTTGGWFGFNQDRRSWSPNERAYVTTWEVGQELDELSQRNNKYMPRRWVDTATYLASTPLPYWDAKTGTAEVGVCCKGCYYASPVTRPPKRDFYNCAVGLRERVYSHEEFLEHFKICAYSRSLWTESQQGTIELNDGAFVKRGGFDFKENSSHRR